MATVATRRTKPDDSPKPNRKGKPLYVWVTPELRAALELARKANRRSLSAEVSVALEQHLRGMDLWPHQ